MGHGDSIREAITTSNSCKGETIEKMLIVREKRVRDDHVIRYRPDLQWNRDGNVLLVDVGHEQVPVSLHARVDRERHGDNLGMGSRRRDNGQRIEGHEGDLVLVGAGSRHSEQLISRESKAQSRSREERDFSGNLSVLHAVPSELFALLAYDRCDHMGQCDVAANRKASDGVFQCSNYEVGDFRDQADGLVIAINRERIVARQNGRNPDVLEDRIGGDGMNFLLLPLC